MPTITPFSVLSALPKGAHLEAIEITITKLWPREPFGENGTKQRTEVMDSEGGKGAVQWIDHDEIPRTWEGKPMRVLAIKNQHGQWSGLDVDEYNNNKRIRIRGRSKSGNSLVSIEWIGQQGRTSAPSSAQQTQRTAGPPPGAMTAQAPQAAKSGLNPVYGATVGMAVKEALSLRTRDLIGDEYTNALDDPAFWQAVHRTSSDIIRVAQMLETGHLATPVKKRAALMPPVQSEPQEQDGAQWGEPGPEPSAETEHSWE